MGEEQHSKLEITLDYSGEKIKNHTIDVKEFTKSLNGFYDLLKLIANTNGFKDEEIKIEIKNVDKGCLKAILIFTISIFFTHYCEKILDKFDKAVIKIYNDAKKIINKKKQISNKNDIMIARQNENDPLVSELFTKKQLYSSIDNFTSCLDTEVENIDVKTNNKNLEKLNINKNERKNLSYIPEMNNTDENLEKKEMILYLDGIQGSTEKWHFFRRYNNKKTKLTAQVLSKKLIEFGRDTSYTDYSNIPLYCDVMIRNFLREGNKNKTTEYYIINCDFYDKNTLL